MTPNNIRSKLDEHKITQADAAKEMPDNVGQVGLSYIVTGKVLPTRDGMAALCRLFDCSPTDLYEPGDINLLSAGSEEAEESVSTEIGIAPKSGRQHDGMTELRAWLRPKEKDMLANAVAELGYRSIAEWLREMIRNTVARNKRLQVKGDAKSV